MTTASYWCEKAWLGGPGTTSGVVVEVAGDRIVAVRPGHDAPPAGSHRLAGLTLPAFANAHSHAFHRALRGRTHHGRGDFWTWRELMYDVAGRLEPDSYFLLARAVFAEMAQAGFGVVGEFHYVHHRPDGAPYGDPNATGAALVAAARDVGIRITLLDTLYLHGGFGDGDGHRRLDPRQRRFGDGSAAAWAERAAALHAVASAHDVRIGAAVHSVRAVDPAGIELAARWAVEREAPLHVHVSEQPAENEDCLARFGATPTAVLERTVALGERTTLVHATHVTADDIAAIAATGSAVCLCPTTERDLGDGIGPSVALAGAGVRICLGSDSHAVVDPLEEARAVELDARLDSLGRGHHPPDELALMATANGYAALGWPDGGVLAPGMLADFVTVGLGSVRLAGAGDDHLLAAVLFAGSSADVDHLVVGGREVVAGGHHTRFDTGAELADAIGAVSGS